MRRRIFLLLAVLFSAWVIVVVTSGIGWNPLNQSWDFTNTGAFGDSFGPLGAMMAAIAAYAAFETLQEQRAEIKRVTERERGEDSRREEADRLLERRRRIQDAIQARQIFESTYFQLLSGFREIINEIDIGKGDNQKTSRDAFKAIVGQVVMKFNQTHRLDIAWVAIIENHKNDLNHYFRFLYHIVSFVDRQESIDRYFYLRLLRASLSEAELILIFINCSVGEGKEKFKPLVEKYAILHNVSEDSKSKWKMNDYLGQGAFDLDDN